MRYHFLLLAREQAAVIPALDSQLGCLDGSLHGQVADPLGDVRVERGAARGAGPDAPGAPLAGDVPGGALEDLEIGNGRIMIRM